MNTKFFVVAMLLLGLSSCNHDDESTIESNVSMDVKIKEDLKRKETNIDRYVDSLNKKILSGAYKVPLKSSSSTSRVSSQSFYTNKGDQIVTVYLNLGIGGFSGFPVKVYNNSRSVTDVNYSVYKVNTNGTLTKLGGQYWDIHPGETSTKYYLSSNFIFSGTKIAVVLENDGYFWQTNIPVYGTVSTP